MNRARGQGHGRDSCRLEPGYTGRVSESQTGHEKKFGSAPARRLVATRADPRVGPSAGARASRRLAASPPWAAAAGTCNERFKVKKLIISKIYQAVEQAPEVSELQGKGRRGACS